MAERLHEQTETRCCLASLRTESTVVRQRARKTEGATHLPEDRRGVEPHSLECRRWRAKALAFTVPPGAIAQSYGEWAAGRQWRWSPGPPWEVCRSGKDPLLAHNSAHSGALSGRQA